MWGRTKRLRVKTGMCREREGGLSSNRAKGHRVDPLAQKGSRGTQSGQGKKRSQRGKRAMIIGSGETYFIKAKCIDKTKNALTVMSSLW